MILVYHSTKLVIKQSQIPDFINPDNIEYRIIKRIRKVNFTNTIRVCTRKRKPSKRFIRKRLKKTYQIKLNRFMIENSPNSSNKKRISNLNRTSKTLAENSTDNEKMENIALVPIGPFLNKRPYMHIDRFYSVPSVVQEDFCNTDFLKQEWKYFQELPSYKGLFQHMLALNSFKYWETVEAEIRNEGFHPKGFTIVEFIKWEFLRHSYGIETYSKAERIFEIINPKLLESAFDRPEMLPRTYHFSHYYKYLKSEHFYTFFQKLVADCVDFGIIRPKITIADGLIFRSWAGNFTVDLWRQPTDPQASITVHNKKFLGKCYNAIVFYSWCGNRWLPIDLRLITGSANENSMFMPLVKDFKDKSPYKCDVFLYDAGASSAQNREFLKSEGIIPGIPARKNIKNEIILDLGKKRYCFAEDIPDGMSQQQYKRLMYHRSQIEAGFSGFTTYNNMKRMNSMGRDMATTHVLKYLCLQLLNALSAYKVNRTDLLMMYSAFSTLV